MFSLVRTCDVSVLVHVQTCAFRRKLPKSLRVFLKTIAMCAHRPLSGDSSIEITSLSQWRSTDIVSALTVMQWLISILTLERLIFINMEANLSFDDKFMIERVYGLSPSSRGNLMIIRSYISALLSGAKNADDDLFAASISSKDPAYITNLLDYIKNVFFFSNPKQVNPYWFLRLEGSESTGSFRELLLSCWENFILDPTHLFNDNSYKSRVILMLLSPDINNLNRFFSIPCIAFLFSCFLCKFFAKYKTSNVLKKEIMMIFSSHLIKSVSIFLHPDLFIQCCLNLIHITGCIISALNIREWYEDRPPLTVNRLKICNGEIICCFSLIEQWKLCSLTINSLNIDNLVSFLASLYDENGRTVNFSSMHYLEVGGLTGSLLWKGWYEVFDALFSSFLSKSFSRHIPYSLSSLSLTSLSENFFKTHKLENITVLADAFSIVVSNGKLEPSCLRARYENLFDRCSYVDFCKKTLLADYLVLSQLEVFSADADYYDINTGHYRNILKTILRLLPFCEKNFLNFIQCYFICEWLLRNLFDLSNSDFNGKAAILNAGSIECGNFIWDLIFSTINVKIRYDFWNYLKPVFCRRITILYISYFCYNANV